MNRRELVAAGISSLATVVSGCSGVEEQSDTRDLSTPDELPAWVADGILDLDTIRSNTVAEMTRGPLVFTNNALSREQTALPVAGSVLEENVTRVKANGNHKIGLYQSATETGGEIGGDLRTASTIEEQYYADGETYYYSNSGPYPSYYIDEGPFDSFADQVTEEISLLFEGEEHVEFEEPAWDEANGVFLVRGTEFDDPDTDTDVKLDTCEMEITEEGVFRRGEVELSVNGELDAEIESTVNFPDELAISEPNWVPEDIGQLTVEVTVEDGEWHFVYGQGGASNGELLLPANHLVELRTTGEHEYRQTFNIPGLRLKLDLIPDDERSREVYISEELVGESYDAYASEISPNHPDMSTEAEILEEDAFDEWLQNSQ